MKALVWCAPYKVKVETVADPEIINSRDAIVRITSTAICGSDLHLVDGFIPFMKPGDILGHEPMGVVEELGPGVNTNKLSVGDRVVVPFFMGCGECFFCKRQLWSCCDNTNPKSYLGETMFGQATAGVLGYSHLTGGFAGGQAEYLRVPLADVNLQKMPTDFTDHQLLFLSDIYPTGYMAAEQCNIQADDTVAVWGCGPVGQFTIRSAMLLGAAQVIAIDDEERVPERLQMARDSGAITIDMHEVDVLDRLLDLTGGIGPDVCIDAVGMEAHGYTAIENFYDKVKTNLFMETERPHAVRQAILCCRKGGTVSIPGVYGGFADKIPLGALIGVIAVGGLFFAADLAVWHVGIRLTKLANASLFGNCSSFLFTIYGFLVLRALPKRMQLAALGLAGAGTALLLGSSYEVSPEHFTGDLFALMAGLFYAFYLIAVDRARRTMAPMPVLAIATAVGAVPLLLVSIALGEQVVPGDWTPLILLSLGSQLIGQGLLVYAMGHLSPVVVGLGLLTQPAAGALIGWLAYGERLSVADAIGALLICIALVLIRLPEKEAPA